LARKARDRLDSPQNPSKCLPLLSLDSIARVWAAAQKQCPKNDRGSTAFPVATPPRHRARRCYHADKRVRKGARPKVLSAPAKALRPALCATALRWARLTRSLRRTGTGMAAVTAGISGMSSGNSSKSATAKANNVLGSVDPPIPTVDHLFAPIARESIFVKEHSGTPIVLHLGSPDGARLERPLRSVNIWRRRSDLAVFDECDVAAIAYVPFECVEHV
jgi:hypothetical protein